MTEGTGIAGAAEYIPTSDRPEPTCHVCGGPFRGAQPASHAARAIAGVGVAEACSAECAADARFAGVGLPG